MLIGCKWAACSVLLNVNTHPIKSAAVAGQVEVFEHGAGVPFGDVVVHGATFPADFEALFKADDFRGEPERDMAGADFQVDIVATGDCSRNWHGPGGYGASGGCCLRFQYG